MSESEVLRYIFSQEAMVSSNAYLGPASRVETRLQNAKDRTITRIRATTGLDGSPRLVSTDSLTQSFRLVAGINRLASIDASNLRESIDSATRRAVIRLESFSEGFAANRLEHKAARAYATQLRWMFRDRDINSTLTERGFQLASNNYVFRLYDLLLRTGLEYLGGELPEEAEAEQESAVLSAEQLFPNFQGDLAEFIASCSVETWMDVANLDNEIIDKGYVLSVFLSRNDHALRNYLRSVCQEEVIAASIVRSKSRRKPQNLAKAYGARTSLFEQPAVTTASISADAIQANHVSMGEFLREENRRIMQRMATETAERMTRQGQELNWRTMRVPVEREPEVGQTQEPLRNNDEF